MIEIRDEDYIGEGEIRTCYVHPQNNDLCIKIPKPGITREYTFKEILYFNKIGKRDTSKFKYPFYSAFHGEVRTNKGDGQVFDLVRDETTGEISRTLEYFIENETDISDDKLDIALSALKQHMTDYRVFTRDLRARNLCCKILIDNSVQLIIIDGIGHRDFFPLADWFKYFSKKKIERTYKRWHFNSIAEQRAFLESQKHK